MKKVLVSAIMAVAMMSCATNNNEEKAEVAAENEVAIETPAIDPVTYKTEKPAEMREVYDFLKACQTYYLATVDGDQPRVRPFGTVNIFDGKLYIQTGHKKNVAKQIVANPKVEICAFNGSEWVRVEATLVEDERIEAKKAMLDAYPNLRSMYDENDGNTAVYFMTNAKANFYSYANFGTARLVEF